MTDKEIATLPNYLTLVCEITLYAYNDYIRRSIDLISLERPCANGFTEKRYQELKNQLLVEIDREYQKRNGVPAPERRMARLLYERLETKKRLLRSDIGICRRYFKDPHPLLRYIEMDGRRAIKQANTKIKHWLETGELKLQVSSRYNFGGEGDGK